MGEKVVVQSYCATMDKWKQMFKEESQMRYIHLTNRMPTHVSFYKNESGIV